jgi:hypothetical protein
LSPRPVARTTAVSKRESAGSIDSKTSFVGLPKTDRFNLKFSKI